MRRFRLTIGPNVNQYRVYRRNFSCTNCFLYKKKQMTTRELLYGLPAKVSPSALEGLATVFHFDIDGGSGGQYTINVADGKINVEEGLIGEPKCVVRASDQNFINLVTCELNPMVAILTGKVKISNQGEMIKYAKIFGLM